MKGSYILPIKLPAEQTITIGSLKTLHFPGGDYAYVGGLEAGLFVVDISKIESGSLELDMRPVTLQPVITDTVNSLQALAQAKGIEIKLTTCKEYLVVNAEQDRIVQIITNLVGNAIKFIPVNGHIDVELNNSDAEAQIIVRDDGPGLSKEEIEKIFDRFVQIHQISGPGEHGTGLGLTITKELIELHGGKIWVESTLGEGCTFYCTLPKHNPADRHKTELVKSAQS